MQYVEVPCRIIILLLFGRLRSLGLFRSTVLRKWRNSQRGHGLAATDGSRRTFFARFFRSLRNLREAFSTLGAMPAYEATTGTHV
jgi:hypothetical protein